MRRPIESLEEAINELNPGYDVKLLCRLIPPSEDKDSASDQKALVNKLKFDSTEYTAARRSDSNVSTETESVHTASLETESAIVGSILKIKVMNRDEARDLLQEGYVLYDTQNDQLRV